MIFFCFFKDYLIRFFFGPSMILFAFSSKTHLQCRRRFSAYLLIVHALHAYNNIGFVCLHMEEYHRMNRSKNTSNGDLSTDTNACAIAKDMMVMLSNISRIFHSQSKFITGPDSILEVKDHLISLTETHNTNLNKINPRILNQNVSCRCARFLNSPPSKKTFVKSQMR